MKQIGIKIIKALAKTKSKDCVGGFYEVWEVDQALVLAAQKFVKNMKKRIK